MKHKIKLDPKQELIKNRIKHIVKCRRNLKKNRDERIEKMKLISASSGGGLAKSSKPKSKPKIYARAIQRAKKKKNYSPLHKSKFGFGEAQYKTTNIYKDGLKQINSRHNSLIKKAEADLKSVMESPRQVGLPKAMEALKKAKNAKKAAINNLKQEHILQSKEAYEATLKQQIINRAIKKIPKLKHIQEGSIDKLTNTSRFTLNQKYEKAKQLLTVGTVGNKRTTNKEAIKMAKQIQKSQKKYKEKYSTADTNINLQIKMLEAKKKVLNSLGLSNKQIQIEKAELNIKIRKAQIKKGLALNAKYTPEKIRVQTNQAEELIKSSPLGRRNKAKLKKELDFLKTKNINAKKMNTKELEQKINEMEDGPEKKELNKKLEEIRELEKKLQKGMLKTKGEELIKLRQKEPKTKANKATISKLEEQIELISRKSIGEETARAEEIKETEAAAEKVEQAQKAAAENAILKEKLNTNEELKKSFNELKKTNITNQSFKNGLTKLDEGIGKEYKPNTTKINNTTTKGLKQVKRAINEGHSLRAIKLLKFLKEKQDEDEKAKEAKEEAKAEKAAADEAEKAAKQAEEAADKAEKAAEKAEEARAELENQKTELEREIKSSNKSYDKGTKLLGIIQNIATKETEKTAAETEAAKQKAKKAKAEAEKETAEAKQAEAKAKQRAAEAKREQLNTNTKKELNAMNAEKKEKAATTVQAVFRGQLVRKQQKRERKAATTIQAAFRRQQERRRQLIKKTFKNAEGSTLNKVENTIYFIKNEIPSIGKGIENINIEYKAISTENLQKISKSLEEGDTKQLKNELQKIGDQQKKQKKEIENNKKTLIEFVNDSSFVSKYAKKIKNILRERNNLTKENLEKLISSSDVSPSKFLVELQQILEAKKATAETETEKKKKMTLTNEEFKGAQTIQLIKNIKSNKTSVIPSEIKPLLLRKILKKKYTNDAEEKVENDNIIKFIKGDIKKKALVKLLKDNTIFTNPYSLNPKFQVARQYNTNSLRSIDSIFGTDGIKLGNGGFERASSYDYNPVFRENIETFMQEDKAATKIQAGFRGMKGRQEAKKVKQEKNPKENIVFGFPRENLREMEAEAQKAAAETQKAAAEKAAAEKAADEKAAAEKAAAEKAAAEKAAAEKAAAEKAAAEKAAAEKAAAERIEAEKAEKNALQTLLTRNSSIPITKPTDKNKNPERYINKRRTLMLLSDKKLQKKFRNRVLKTNNTRLANNKNLQGYKKAIIETEKAKQSLAKAKLSLAKAKPVNERTKDERKLVKAAEEEGKKRKKKPTNNNEAELRESIIKIVQNKYPEFLKQTENKSNKVSKDFSNALTYLKYNNLFNLKEKLNKVKTINENKRVKKIKPLILETYLKREAEAQKAAEADKQAELEGTYVQLELPKKKKKKKKNKNETGEETGEETLYANISERATLALKALK